MERRGFATFLWSEVASMEVAWREGAPPGEGTLARPLRTRYGPWLTFPAGARVVGTDHELVYVELPIEPPMLYAMCGLAFSGKSTFARRLAARTGAEVVSLDAILAGWGLFGGDGLEVEAWERASHEAMDRVRALAGEGRSVVLDDTCSRRFLRQRYLRLADELDLGFLVIHLDIPVETARERMARAARTGERRILRPEVFEAHVAEFEPPGEDEAVERFCDEETPRRWIDSIPV
jgi:predicted kinase